MSPHPQPPERRVLDDVADPASVLREAEVPYGAPDPGPVRVDLLFTENPFFAEILTHHAETKTLPDTAVRCATPRGNILLKLFALPSLYRQGNVRRAAVHETDILQLLTLQTLPSVEFRVPS